MEITWTDRTGWPYFIFKKSFDLPASLILVMMKQPHHGVSREPRESSALRGGVQVSDNSPVPLLCKSPMQKCQSPIAPTKKSEWGQWGSFKDGVTAEQNKQSSHTSHVLCASPPPITKLQLGKHTCGLTTPTFPLQFLGTHEGIMLLQGCHGTASKTRIHSRGSVIYSLKILLNRQWKPWELWLWSSALLCPSRSKLWYSGVSQAAATGRYLQMLRVEKNPRPVDQCVAELTGDIPPDFLSPLNA